MDNEKPTPTATIHVAGEIVRLERRRDRNGQRYTVFDLDAKGGTVTIYAHGRSRFTGRKIPVGSSVNVEVAKNEVKSRKWGKRTFWNALAKPVVSVPATKSKERVLERLADCERRVRELEAALPPPDLFADDADIQKE